MQQSVAELVQLALAGNPRAIAKLMTLAERGQPALELFAYTGRAHIVGITGVPGSGKSTLVRALAAVARARARKVGVVAVDPSSPFTGGAILGDRIRMNDLCGDGGIFIRSMASRGAMGGLARAALDVVDVLDAAGFDHIFIETLGVGQDEVDIARAAHTVCVVSAPGLGDGVQAIKSGLLEIADIHAVSKADRADSARTAADLRDMPGMGAHPAEGDWSPPVLATSAERGTGIGELLDAIEAHGAWLRTGDGWMARLRMIAGARMLKIAEDQLRVRLAQQRGQAHSRIANLIERIATHQLHPALAAREFLDEPMHGQALSLQPMRS